MDFLHPADDCLWQIPFRRQASFHVFCIRRLSHLVAVPDNPTPEIQKNRSCYPVCNPDGGHFLDQRGNPGALEFFQRDMDRAHALSAGDGAYSSCSRRGHRSDLVEDKRTGPAIRFTVRLGWIVMEMYQTAPHIHCRWVSKSIMSTASQKNRKYFAFFCWEFIINIIKDNFKEMSG